MDEAEWLTSSDVARMLRWRQGSDPLLRPLSPLSDRKLRLFAVALTVCHY